MKGNGCENEQKGNGCENEHSVADKLLHSDSSVKKIFT